MKNFSEEEVQAELLKLWNIKTAIEAKINALEVFRAYKTTAARALEDAKKANDYATMAAKQLEDFRGDQLTKMFFPEEQQRFSYEENPDSPKEK